MWISIDMFVDVFKIKFEHFIHDVFLVMHNHLSSFITLHAFN